MTLSHWFWAFARPALMWACLVLLLVGLHESVSDVKYQTLSGLTVLLFFFRGCVDKGFIERVLTIWRQS